MSTVTRFYSNVAVANTIGNAGGISSGATQFNCTTTPSGYPSQFPFTIALEPNTANEELINVTSGSGTVGSPWHMTRGYDGTTAKTHAQTTAVTHPFSASDTATSRTHESLDSGTGSQPHGLPLAAWQGASFAAIQETTLANSTTSTVSWTSIPQTYNHLLIVCYGRLTSTGAQDGSVTCTVNGDTNSRYMTFDIGCGTESGSLTDPYSNTTFAQSNWNAFLMLAASQAGNSVNGGGGFMLLPNYVGTTMNKMAVGISGYGNGNGSAGSCQIRWGFYNPTSQAAITSLSMGASIGNYTSGTFLGLYGLG